MNLPYESLLNKLCQLNLSTAAKTFETYTQKHPDKASSIAAALEGMFDEELRAKAERRIHRCIHDAHFTRIQTIDTFDFDYNSSTKKIKTRYMQLVHTNPIAQGVGAIFCGNAGLGKTHLARALGYRICQQHYSVLFIPCATLLNRLITADVQKTLERECKKLLTPALLIVDELGYVTMSQQEANLFFQTISRRHDNKKPTVVTTNKPFTEWNQVFHGDGTAHAIVDRLTECAEIFYLEGKSYRQTHRTGLKIEH